jgi:hypothetical protein
VDERAWFADSETIIGPHGDAQGLAIITVDAQQ